MRVPEGRLKIRAVQISRGVEFVGLILLDRLLLRRVLRDEVGGAVSLCIGSKSTQDFILGNSLPSLSGLDRFSVAYPALRAGLLSAVPIGTGSVISTSHRLLPRHDCASKQTSASNRRKN